MAALLLGWRRNVARYFGFTWIAVVALLTFSNLHTEELAGHAQMQALTVVLRARQDPNDPRIDQFPQKTFYAVAKKKLPSGKLYVSVSPRYRCLPLAGYLLAEDGEIHISKKGMAPSISDPTLEEMTGPRPTN